MALQNPCLVIEKVELQSMSFKNLKISKKITDPFEIYALIECYTDLRKQFPDVSHGSRVRAMRNGNYNRK